MICDNYSVVVVPFPFTDLHKTKRRPALVISSADFNRNGHTVMAMITTQRDPSWPGDTEIAHHASAGLDRPCIIRLKLFTLDNRLLLRSIGHLHDNDLNRVAAHFKNYLLS